MRLLVVEDEDAIASFIRQGLEETGYAVDLAADGAEALHWAAIATYDLVILDVMLPEIGGLDVCAALRRRGLRIPVLMLTARDAVEDRVAGLDSGADDYLIKPFAFAELLARMRALMRRGPASDAHLLTIGSLALDATTRTVTRNGQEIDLTTREFELLEHMMRSPGQVVSRETLAREVWNESGRSTSRTASSSCSST